jgi:alkanesulfonate monooxygenase SsuD/methylene tetrahydromethanopterin reductase-like flavin-dependent oxidoreductase (luciferase family)
MAPPPHPAPYRRTRTLHLAAAIDGREPHAAARCAEMVRLSERGGLDFVTLDCGGEAVLDALAVPARVASVTDRIGVLPALPAGRADPGPAVATLDWLSHGRAGWAVAPCADGTGTVQAAAVAAAGAGAAAGAAGVAEAVEAVVRGWDACARANGSRPPQGRPVIAVDADGPAARHAAARHADIAFVRAGQPERAAQARGELRRLAAESGRDPDRLLVLAELRIDLGGGELGQAPGAKVAPVPDGRGGLIFRGGPVDLAELLAAWHGSGAVDGFHVRPVETRRDLERFVNGTVALLQHRGLFRTFHPGATLREHLGLHRLVRGLAPAGGPAS